mgnify:CR=1 FL=1
MTTDELQCVDACKAAKRLCNSAVASSSASVSDVLITSADICGVAERVLTHEAGFGSREIAVLCSKLCRSAADHVLKAAMPGEAKELVDALIEVWAHLGIGVEQPLAVAAEFLRCLAEVPT